MENKPIVTCHGDQALFSKLHGLVVQGLPREHVEWRRSYGRAPKTIQIEANFVPFNPDILPTEDDWTLLGRPFFHTYWTDCDVDTYKSIVRDEIAEWTAALKSCNISDWMIIVVGYDESKVKSKLLRTSVYDKIKSDFCAKSSDRCIVLSEPTRTDSKSSESWGQVLSRIRQLLLQSFNKNLSRFEEYMRAQREKRQESGWSFFNYFLLQEELAFMFEMLDLYEDALVQYDELDALFTQFVLNHAAGASAEWLNNFADILCTTWDGLCLSQPINIEKRHLIKHSKASLLDLRNYLFSRQCMLLFQLKKPWEVAQRSIPFTHNCIKELEILELNLPQGAVACWIFLTCLEVLQTCEKHVGTSEMHSYSLHTVGLWDYARKKMFEVANMFGLGPGSMPSEAQLLMLEKILNGAAPVAKVFYTNKGESEPLNKLREALSSKQSFSKHYLELSELAMGTYKHIGRMRSARLIGKDLADFYIKRGDYQKAESFLSDALNIYKQEGWYMLADDTRLQLARCQKTLDQARKYVKSCSYIAASQMLDFSTREFYQQELIDTAKGFVDKPVTLRSFPVFSVTSINPTKEHFALEDECQVNISIVNNLPNALAVSSVVASLTPVDSADMLNMSQNSSSILYNFKKKHSREHSFSSFRSRHSSTSSTNEVDLYGPDTVPQRAAPAALEMAMQFEKTVNQTVVATSVVCKTPLKRLDSGHMYHRERDICKEEYNHMVSGEAMELPPGLTEVVLTGKMDKKGSYYLSQLCLNLVGVEFLKNFPQNSVQFEVVSDEPTVIFEKEGPLIAGQLQEVKLQLLLGSFMPSEATELVITAPTGVTFSGETLQDGKIHIDVVEAHKPLEFMLNVITELQSNAEEESMHMIICECSWFKDPVENKLTFKHPFKLVHKLHTSGKRKYVQIMTHSNTGLEFILSDQSLMNKNNDIELLMLNPPETVNKVNEHQSMSYLWEIKSNIAEAPPLNLTFMFSYQSEDMSSSQTCSHNFTIENYQTRFITKSKLTMEKDCENYQAGLTYVLILDIVYVSAQLIADQQLFYEVVCNPSHWVVNGKTASFFKMTGDKHHIELEVIPVTGGLLPLPIIKLYRCSPVKGDNVEEKSAIAHSEVYNQTSGSQVKVLPAQSDSHVEIVVG